MGELGVLQSMGLQKVRDDLVTEQRQQQPTRKKLCPVCELESFSLFPFTFTSCLLNCFLPMTGTHVLENH